MILAPLPLLCNVPHWLLKRFYRSCAIMAHERFASKILCQTPPLYKGVGTVLTPTQSALSGWAATL